MQKTINELKHGILYMSEHLGVERKIRKVFDELEKRTPDVWSISEQQIRVNLFKIALELGCIQEINSCIQHFDRLPKRRKSERETRQNILNNAKKMGIPKEDVINIFNKYDDLLKIATSEQERQQISYMGGAELQRLLDVRGPLIMDGKEILPPKPEFVAEDLSKFKKIK